MNNKTAKLLSPYIIGIIVICFYICSCILKSDFLSNQSESIKYSVAIRDFHNNLVKDSFFPKWASSFGNGYGYPVFIFSPILFYFISEPFYLMGIPVYFLVNLISCAAVFGCGLIMFLLANSANGRTGGFISSVCYVFSPALISTLFNFTDFDEVYSFIFFPLTCYLIRIYFTDENRELSINTVDFIVLSLCSASLFMTIKSTLISALMLFIWLIIHCAVSKNSRKWKILFLTSGGVINGLWFSAFYWLSAILEWKYTFGSTTGEYTASFLPVQIAGNTFVLNLAVIFSVCFLTGFLFREDYYRKRYKLNIFIFTVFLALFFYGFNSISNHLERIKKISSITIREEKLPYCIGIEYMPEVVKKFPEKIPQEPLEPVSGKLKILKKEIYPQYKWIRIKVTGGGAVARFNLFYYPGWIFRIKDYNVENFTIDETGRIIMQFPDGMYFIKAIFNPSATRTISDLMSFGAVIFLVFLFIYMKEPQK